MDEMKHKYCMALSLGSGSGPEFSRTSRVQPGQALKNVSIGQSPIFFPGIKTLLFRIKNNSSVTLLSYLLILVSFYRNCDNNSYFPIVVVIIQYDKFRIILFWKLGVTGLPIWKSCEEGGRVRGHGVWVWIRFLNLWRKSFQAKESS